MRRELAVRAREREIARLAGAQHGVVGRRQLAALGFSARAIDRRLEHGRLHPLHRGVYTVGHRRVSARGRWIAGVLAGGPGAVLSHQAAAALWDLLRFGGAPHVTVAGRVGPREGLRVHCGRFQADEATVIDGIPTTTVARTLLDLAAVLPRDRLETAVAEAERRRLADQPSLPDLMVRYPGRRGAAALRKILANRRLGLDLPRSELEQRFVAFLDRRGLPAAGAQCADLTVGGRTLEVDCLWRRMRLVVELDSRAWHSDPVAFEEDRARDRAPGGRGLAPDPDYLARICTAIPTGLDREPQRRPLRCPTSS